MREKIQQHIREVNTWVFTLIAIIFAVILTTGLNSFFVWMDGGRYKPKIFMYATIDAIVIPLIIAPIMINAFKRILNLEKVNQLLQERIDVHQFAQRSAEERVAHLQAVGDFSITCAAATPDTDLFKLIAEKLHAITGALGVGISEYDVKERVLITRFVSVSGQVLTTLNHILGQNIIGLRSPISPETLQRITQNIVEVSANLNEVTFGAVPKPISTMAQNALNVGSFTGLGFLYDGRLWGAAVIVTRKGQSPIDHDLAVALANVAAMTMRRQKTEEALQASEARYRILADMSPDAITLTDLSGNINYCNHQTAAIHGYENTDYILGTNVISYFAQEEHAKVLEMIQNALAFKQTGDTPFTLIEQDGSRFPGEIRTCIVPDADGNPTSIIGITRDITGRKKAELERETLIRELMGKNQELEQFTYTVSHDLKAPMITIKGFLGMLQKDVDENRRDRVHGDIQRITEATEKMQRLLNEVLELSRIRRIMNEPENVPVADIVYDALERVHGRIESLNVNIKVRADLPFVHGDRQRLTEVLQNLIDNTAKYMGKQTNPLIEIGQLGEDNNVPILYVKDNGIGIAPEHHGRIFGLFNKLDSTSEGTGIGLALVKKIIEVHGGRIWVESEAGKGSTFYFTLPTAAAS